jgi:hypothetical protein
LPIPHLQPHPVVPPRRLTPEHYHTLKSFHGGVIPHTGVAPMLQAMRAAGQIWDTLEEDVAEFVSRCHYCQLERLTRRGPESLPYRSVQIPSTLCETYHFDILGPLPPCVLTGARFIFICVEETSKLVFLDRSVEASVIEIMLFLLDCFKTFGLPHTIKTDRAGVLVGKAVTQLCHFTGIEHRVGVAHYHQSDGTVENGAALVWPYLRIMGAELRKFHAWAPLLCNVQLAANALVRDVLGGASASEVMFNRKVKPLQFLRPEALEADAGPVSVNKFIADNAAMQLRLLGRADAERHRRFRLNAELAEEARDGLEHLDWVREGLLVSIPQPDADQHFNRPNKFAFLRRGPYEVVEVRPRTALLRDYRKSRAGQQPPEFLWPKFNMAPYYSMGDILPPQEEVIHFPFEDLELEPLQPAELPPLPSAVLSSSPLPEAEWRVQRSPNHVRNHSYMVRWENKPHSANSTVRYEAIWSSWPFQEFVQGSGLIGHVPPQQVEHHHVRQVNALLQGNRQPQMLVPMADPQAQVRVLRDYFPYSEPQRPHASGVAHAAAFSQGLRDDFQEVEQVQDDVMASSQQSEQVLSQDSVRRSTRNRRATSYGSDFV